MQSILQRDANYVQNNHLNISIATCTLSTLTGYLFDEFNRCHQNPNLFI